jgi:hypothetical protein
MAKLAIVEVFPAVTSVRIKEAKNKSIQTPRLT